MVTDTTAIPKNCPPRGGAPAVYSTGAAQTPLARSGELRVSRWLLPLVLLVALWFGLLGERPLWDPDEGRYAEIPREMVETGDWIVPRLNGLLYLEKPPLQYWTTAAAFELFGQHNWSARLWSALTGLAGLALVFYAGRRLHSRQAGLYAALMLASSLLYFAAAHFNTLDMGVAVFMSLTVFSLAIGLRRETGKVERAFWVHLAWAGAGFAVLSKGLIGAVLPAAAFIGYVVVCRDYALLRRTFPLSGTALFLAIAAPWFVAVARDQPDFAQFFFVHEHFTRFLTTEHRRGQPWWFFVPVLVLGSLPWTVPMLMGWWRALRLAARRGFEPHALLAIWAVVVFAFFSASGSKLPGYIVPLFPALALLAARYVCESPRGRITGRGMMVLAFSAMTVYQLVMVGVEELVPAKSASTLAQQMKPQLRDATHVYALELYPRSLSFYLGRTVTVVNFRDELDFGLAREPHKTIATLEAFVEKWRAESDAVAVMRRETHAALLAKDVPMTIIAEDAARVAVRRP